jgi:hypothetical protein
MEKQIMKKSGRNVWECQYCDKVTIGPKDGSRPERCTCKGKEYGYDFDAVPNMRRVKGDRYKPYGDDTEWATSADQILMAEANINFRLRGRK